MAFLDQTSTALPPPLVQALDLSRTSAAGGAQLLHVENFALVANTQVAITGASGSGKSVFLRALALLDSGTTGTIVWQGEPVRAEAIPGYRTRVCYVPQKPAFIDGTVQDNLRLPFTLKSLRGRSYDLQAVHHLLAQAGKAPAFLEKNSADLSGGEAQIAALVRALQLAPQVMLFDEPTAALDPQSAAAVEGLVQAWFAAGAGERAYVWVSHDPEQAERMSTQRLYMHQGELSARATP